MTLHHAPLHQLNLPIVQLPPSSVLCSFGFLDDDSELVGIGAQGRSSRIGPVPGLNSPKMLVKPFPQEDDTRGPLDLGWHAGEFGNAVGGGQ